MAPAKRIHQIAQADTPSAVHVPSTPAGLLIWAIGRFGGTAVLAVVSLYAAWFMYSDMKQLMRDVMEQSRAMALLVQSNTLAMEKMVTAMDRLQRDIEFHSRTNNKQQ